MQEGMLAAGRHSGAQPAGMILLHPMHGGGMHGGACGMRYAPALHDLSAPAMPGPHNLCFLTSVRCARHAQSAAAYGKSIQF